jgi:hypothetical protein
MNHMSRNGMPTFAEILAAHRETDPEKQMIAFAILDLKRTGAIIRSQNRKKRIAAIEAEHQRVETKEAADRAWGVQQNARIQEIQAQMRSGALSTRNRGW